MVKVYEMEESLKIIEQAVENIADGDVFSAIPKRVRPPEGEIYFRTETPRGELGYYIVSDGTVNPSRVKARSPAFCNLSLISQISKGAMIADMVAIIGSLDIVLGEIDR
jgi:NADH-quinone oxidoreductase subunit D